MEAGEQCEVERDGWSKETNFDRKEVDRKKLRRKVIDNWKREVSERQIDCIKIRGQKRNRCYLIDRDRMVDRKQGWQKVKVGMDRCNTVERHENEKIQILKTKITK